MHRKQVSYDGDKDWVMVEPIVEYRLEWWAEDWWVKETGRIKEKTVDGDEVWNEEWYEYEFWENGKIKEKTVWRPM